MSKYLFGANKAQQVLFVPAEAGTQFFGQILDARFRGHERRLVHTPCSTGSACRIAPRLRGDDTHEIMQ